MKIFILIFILFISPIDLRQHNNNIYEIDDLINNNEKFDRYKYRLNKEYDNDDDDDDEYIPPSISEHRKIYPSHKKLIDNQDEFEKTEKLDEMNMKSIETDQTCIKKYELKSEQLVKVKELKNGAHMIQYILLDKRTLSSNFNIRQHCMLSCCSKKTCDVAMLSEQPTHDGYKCYLFACNGNCTFASHQDYTIMLPKIDATYYTSKMEDKSTSTIQNIKISKRKSFFHETSLIIFLIFGLISTIILFIYLFRYCRDSQKRGRKLKNYSVDADYLINGLYL